MLCRLALLPILVVVLSPASAPQPHPTSGPTVFALLVNNHLLAVRATTGAVISDRVLAPAPVPRPLAFRGYYLALSKDRESLYILVLGKPQARDYLVVVDVATTRVQKWYALARGIIFLSVAVGPVSGRIYLFGNRAGDAIVTVLDPRTGSALSTRVVRRGHGVNWRIYRGLVWSNERELFINYWRGGGRGIDAVSLPGARLQGCRAAQGVGCFWPEGLNIEQYGGPLRMVARRLLATALGVGVTLDV